MTSTAVFLNGQAKDAGERQCLGLLGGLMLNSQSVTPSLPL